MKDLLHTLWEEVARPMFLRPKRVQYAALCTREVDGKTQVLLITSRGTGRWIIPKGWPIDGLDGAEIALQEAWEEAGVRADKTGKEPVGQYHYDKGMKDGTEQSVTTWVYRIDVTDLADEFPEAHERKRCWVSPETAAGRVQEPGLRDLLLQM